MSKLLSRALILFLLAALLPVDSTRAELPQPSTLYSILSSSPIWSTYGGMDGAEYGHSVASAGDINNDGYDDVVVGSYQFKVGDPIGAAFIYLGGPTGLSQTAHATLYSPTLEKGSYFGYAVSGVGDVNADGYADIIVGAPSHHEDVQGAGDNGAAYLFLGSSTGVHLTPDWDFIGPNDSQFGASVAGAGDVNGDGYDDVLIGAVQFSQPEIAEGAAYLFLGSASGLESSPSWTVQSNLVSAQLGYDVAGIGDLNHDGYADFAISAPTADLPPLSVTDPIRTDAGMVWVFLGSTSGPAPSTPNWTAQALQPNTLFGSSIDSAGDVDSNGYVDLIIGARGVDSALMDIGAAYIYYNDAAGLSATPGWVVTSDQTSSGFGSAVTGLGDVNMDGYDDVGVGAYRYDGDQSYEGMVFVFNGSSAGAYNIPFWSAGGDKADSKFGASLAGAGDVNGDGRYDLIAGAPSYMRDQKTRMGAAFVFHGMATGDLPTLFHHVFLPVLIR